MQKEVMVKAVKMARRFEGDWIARMSLALKMAWAIIRKSVVIKIKTIDTWLKEIENSFNEEGLSVRVNAWEKHGLRRLYINAGYDGIGYIEIDDNSNYVKSWVDRSFFNFGSPHEAQGRAIEHFSVIKRLLDGGNW